MGSLGQKALGSLHVLTDDALQLVIEAFSKESCGRLAQTNQAWKAATAARLDEWWLIARVEGRDGFQRDMTLQELTLPVGLRTIGERAFEYCRNLRSIVLPETLTSIKHGATASLRSSGTPFTAAAPSKRSSCRPA